MSIIEIILYVKKKNNEFHVLMDSSDFVYIIKLNTYHLYHTIFSLAFNYVSFSYFAET